MNFTLLNLGIGIGGVLGGFFVDVSDARTFQAIYLADAVSYLPALLLLLGPLRHIAGRSSSRPRTTQRRWATSRCCAARRWRPWPC